MLTSVIRRCCCLNATRVKQFKTMSLLNKKTSSYNRLKVPTLNILEKRMLNTSNTLMIKENYYEVLGIRPNSTQKEIREAFLELTQPLHPINNSKKSDQYERYRKAYNTLKVESKRKEHDKDAFGADLYDDVGEGARSKIYQKSKNSDYENPEKYADYSKKNTDDFQFDGFVKFSLLLIAIFIYILSQLV